MNKNTIFLAFLALILLNNCRSESSQKTKHEQTSHEIAPIEKDISQIALVECIKKGIYYINEVDVSTYDSISTQYFHQVIDYTDSVATETEKELEKLNYIIEFDNSSNYTNEQLDSIIAKAHLLKKDLSHYQKSVIGYVFVHTFLNKKDTMSAIIIANSDCSKSDAILIKTITDLEPDYYKQKIKNIEK